MANWTAAGPDFGEDPLFACFPKTTVLQKPRLSAGKSPARVRARLRRQRADRKGAAVDREVANPNATASGARPPPCDSAAARRLPAARRRSSAP